MTRSIAILGTRGYPSYYGGFETAVRKLAPYLADEGWDVTVYGRPNSIKTNDPERDPRVRSIITHGMDKKALSTISYGLTATLDAMRRKPDVVLVMNVANGFWLPLLKIMRIPTVINVDGMEWERAKWGRLAKFVFKTGARFTGWFGTELVYDSVEIARRWKTEFKRDGRFIPYGGDVEAVLPVRPGLQHRKYVLFVARLVPENSVAEFLEAAEVLSLTMDVVIVGTSAYGSEYDTRLRELAAKRDSVHVLGHVSNDAELHSLWQHAGAYFHGHSVGGTNPALVQAMASAAPIVARDTVYNREVLADAALYAQPDASSIVTAVQRVMADVALQEEISTHGQRRAVDLYSWSDVCDAYIEAVEATIEATSSPRVNTITSPR
ncbi:MAG: glycosyl transferase [Microbacteriaceae bacterium]|jgi:glycosyltransferase involved in cell wall biosynthesis|nr:glycosyl transferase [Microbacteriaceae bacterium]